MQHYRNLKIRSVLTILTVFTVLCILFSLNNHLQDSRLQDIQDRIHELDCGSHVNLTFDEFNPDVIDDGSYIPSPKQLVPNIVHYILFTIHEIEFSHFVSILSVLKNQKPDIIYIHCDCHQLTGDYWPRVLRLAQLTETRLIVRSIFRPFGIFGRKFNKLWLNWHASDITRIRVLREFGGIYLDRDVYVVRSLNRFRTHEMTIDFEGNGTVLASQTLIAHKNARFLKLWLLSYCEYDSKFWYYNTGVLPTKEIIEKRPELIHRLNGEFGADSVAFCPLIYHSYYKNWRQKFYAFHLLIRGDYLSPNGWCLGGNRPKISQFNEQNIRQLNTTFGEMTREVFAFETQLVNKHSIR